MKKKSNKIGQIIRIIIIFCLIAAFIGLFTSSSNGKNIINFTSSELYNEITKENVETITMQPNGQVVNVTGTLESKDENGEPEKFSSIIMTDENSLIKIEEAEELSDIIIIPPPEMGMFFTIILSFLPILLIIGFFYLMMKNAAGSNDKAMSFGKSRAKRSTQSNMRFSDVAGYEEEKEELKEVVDFLKNPVMYNKMGAKIPKGVLLIGPPGTGKTLLAKSAAGEASVPFFSISGSDFVEMFVGVGASRVRDMFKEAKKIAPCIIFIDEIDAVGRQRGAGMGGGNDEREQTLNQLLVEMDGFGANTGIILLAATNRPDVLDPALLRPGRFDRQVTIDLPDITSRELILELHASKKKLSDDIKLADVARRTPGFSGADLENILNEAAIISVRQKKKQIDASDLSEGIDRIIAGPAKKNRKVSKKERKLVSHHESGHAVIGLELSSADVLEKVTIVPRGRAGGYAIMVPKEDRYFATKGELLDKITGLLGGRAAEEIFLKEISTGANNDFERASKIAKSMVCEYGMSKLGIRQFEQSSKDVFLGRDYGKERAYSDGVSYEIDREVSKILDDCYKRSKRILNKRKKDVLLLAKTLLDVETLDAEEINYLMRTRKKLVKKESKIYSEKEIKEIHKRHEKIEVIKKEIFQLNIQYNKINYVEDQKNKDEKLKKIKNEKIKKEAELKKLEDFKIVSKKKVIKKKK